MSDYVFTFSSGESVPVTITTRRGVRNITLRPKTRPTREIHISKPWLTRDAAALNFLESKRKWCERIFANAPTKTKLKSGDTIEFLGMSVKLVHDPLRHGNELVRADDAHATLYVGGDIDMFERRVRDFIKSEFLITLRKMIHAAPLDVRPSRIALRDTTSRWGSCSSTGTISFSWRLAFAPYDVMRYVVMHELAHRRHMDHSPEFWATVREFYGFGVERAKRWLSQNGGELHRYF